jgi:hypothetical protein
MSETKHKGTFYMTPSRRSRVFPYVIKGSPVKDSNNKTVWDAGKYSSKGIQVTVSEGHKKSPTGVYYEGGPFFTASVKARLSSRAVSVKSRTAPYTYDGPAICGLIPSIYGGYTDFESPKALGKLEDSSYLDPIGAEAISIVDPTNPNAQTGVALGEILSDRRLPIPGIQAWKQRTEAVRAAGSEYLNAQFGWLPLVSDIQDTAQSVRDGATILENYRASSGTLVHREFEFPRIESESESVVSTTARLNLLFDGSHSGFNDPAGPATLSRNRKSVTRRWFSGSFTYHAAGGNTLEDAIRAKSDANKLFGVSLTPDLVWELTPWSWAVDWFSNASNVIHNIGSSIQAGLVMKYGYMMEETTIVDTYSLSGTGIYGLGGSAPTSSIEFNSKRRRVANPFGFGLSWDGLSPTQLAITAALGLTRLR